MLIDDKHRVAMDVRMVRHTGIGRYIRGTLFGFGKKPPHIGLLLVGYPDDASHFNGFAFKTVKAPLYSLTEQVQIPFAAAGCECLHVPHYNGPIFWKKKLIITVHDLIHLHFPENLPSYAARCYARFLLPTLVRRADAIISVSEYTKKDLVERLGADSDKITVVHHGIDPVFVRNGQTQGQKRSEDDTSYFLYVGLLKAHKNVGLLLAAFKRLAQTLKNKKIKLIIVGRPDGRQPIVRQWVEEIKNSPNIVHKQDVEDWELVQFYRGAVALILPSLFEGFGFPLLEAMACGTPIIASNATSIPEVAGESALYFDPHSEQELVESMRQVMTNGSLREQLVNKGDQRLKAFNWERSAEKTIHVYESVIGKA